MDSMTSAELVETSISLINMLDMQFQYWLGITFAVIVASFTTGNRLTLKIRIVIATLFLCSSIAFFDRYLVLNANITTFIGEVLSRGIPWEGPLEINLGFFQLDSGKLRRLVMIIGTITTVWFLYSNANLTRDDKN